jgi:mycothiol synthase
VPDLDSEQHPDSLDQLDIIGRLSSEQVEAVTALVAEASDVDGVPPLSEHVMLHLRYGGDEATHNLLLWRQGLLAGYAHLDVTDLVEGPSAELVVRPTQRRHGVGRALVTATLAQSGGRLRLWAHGGLPDAVAMAERLGFRQTRVLLQLRRSLLAALPRVELAEGVTMRTFVSGQDDDEWLALNGLAFAHHPEQGGWTIEDLHQRIEEDWFDPSGFLLAEHGGSMVGFVWTKVHGGAHSHHQGPARHDHSDGSDHASGSSDVDHGHDPIGEIYVIGVHPKAQGMGLGRHLTVAGLRYLRRRGLHQVMLYVDESNQPAIRLYESLGFSRWDLDVLFRHGPN